MIKHKQIYLINEREKRRRDTEIAEKQSIVPKGITENKTRKEVNEERERERERERDGGRKEKSLCSHVEYNIEQYTSLDNTIILNLLAFL